MTATIDFMLKVLESSELDREEIKKLLEEKLVKESVFITGNHTPILVELFKENYHMSPKIDESEILILSRIYADGAHMFSLGKKNKSLQESLYEENEEHIEHISDDIYEKLAFVMIEEKISRPERRNLYITRYVAIKDEEGKRIIIDKILDMLFEKEKDIEIQVEK
jgi:hypothetical protein